MGGGGRNRREQNYWNEQAKTQNAAIVEKTPLEKELEAKSLNRLNWEKEGRTDISDPRAGLQNYIQIGRAAIDRSKRERMGTGALQLGDAASSGYTENLKTLRQNETAQEFGAGLEQADAMAHAEATGSVMPLAQLTTNRNIARAGNSAQMFSQWNQRKSKNWWDYMSEGIGMATNIGGALFGGG